MLLRKMTLTNFRPFKGTNEIIFSTDKEKNITLVIAENGAGKTTLAQAFQWILYAKAEGFKSTSVLNGIIDKNMNAGDTEFVIGSLELEHNGILYTIIRKQKYIKESTGPAKIDSTDFKISTKTPDGKTNIINELRTKSTVSSIMPETLSKYFFFDGERINRMATEVGDGKSEEFKTAVQNILGLSALIKAMEHLNPGSKNSVIGKINAQIADSGSEEIKRQRDIIYDCTDKIKANEDKIDDIEQQITYYEEKIEESKNEIKSYAESEEMQRKLDKLNSDLINEKKNKNNTIIALLSSFSTETKDYLSRHIVKDSLVDLKNTDNIDKGIPSIRDDTISYLINRKKCICGADLSNPTSDACKNLMALLDYIPPQSLGTSIKLFQQNSKNILNNTEKYEEKTTALISAIKGMSNKIDEIEKEIGEYNDLLLKSDNEKVMQLKDRQNQMEADVNKFRKDLIDLKAENKTLENMKQNAEAEFSRLSVMVDKNKILEEKLKYAKIAYEKIKQTYDEEEEKIRKQLNKTINDLFTQIYAGGISISIDEKYRIESKVTEIQDFSIQIDANTAKQYSIIFAFIVGVIDLARKKVISDTEKNGEDSSIVTDEYPLVMDAPLSSFDMRRIKNVCDVIPNIARQVIIFIKDTDGNIAKSEMQSNIGIEYEVSLVDSKTQLESKITKVGE